MEPQGEELRRLQVDFREERRDERATPLHIAVSESNEAQLRGLIEAGVDLDAQNPVRLYVCFYP